MMYLVLQITPDLRVFRIPEYLVTPAESDALASWPETATGGSEGTAFQYQKDIPQCLRFSTSEYPERTRKQYVI